jgi:hypothetical protein
MGNNGVAQVEVPRLRSSSWSIKSSNTDTIGTSSQLCSGELRWPCSGASCRTPERMTYTTIRTATKIDAHPAQVAHPRLWKVRMLATEAVTTVARKDHQTVQAAWVDSVLMPMDTPRIPDPETSTKLQTIVCQTSGSSTALASVCGWTYPIK